MSQPELRRPDERLAELTAADPEFRALMPDPWVTEAIRRPGLSLCQVVTTVLDGYADRVALGARHNEVVPDPAGGSQRALAGSFDTITYAELHGRVKRLATVWRHHELYRVVPGEFVWILGFTSADYVTVDLATVYAHAVCVPLQSTLAVADLGGIAADTEPAVVAAEMPDLVLAARLAGAHASIRTVIALGCDPAVDDDRDRLAAAEAELARGGSAARLVTLADLIATADPLPAWQPLPADPAGADRMAMLIHSSGSTGTPKGVIITDRTAASLWDPGERPIPTVRVAFAPLNHLVGRGQVFQTLARGGRVSFTATTDLSTVFEDIRLTRPTELLAFPRLLELVHHHFVSEVVRRAADTGDDVAAARAEVLRQMRDEFLGDRLIAISVGGAPVAPELERFIEECFQIQVENRYGSTEAGPVTVMGRIERPPVLDYKLRDVPDLGYFRTDKPYPRGELCVRSERSTPGYFKRPEATAALFDAEGYLRTGDIVEERGPDRVEWIGRRNDVLKLAQGEFVDVSALATAYEDGSALIDQAFVYGNSVRAYLVAVIVPNPDVLRRRLGEHPAEASVRDLIRAELRDIATREGLRSFEVPRDFLIEHEPFSHENGLLSSVHKRVRPALQAKYRDRLEELYAQLEARQTGMVAELRTLDASSSVLDRIGEVLKAALGVDELDPSLPFSFQDLGGDSLGAAEFSLMLADTFGVDVPVGAILSPTATPRTWAALVESALDSSHTLLATFGRVHGVGAQTLRASDLDISAFLPDEVLAAAPARPSASSPPRCVLLTGATGFLGRFLCLAWLERLAAVDGRLVCLVRGSDAANARRRLAAVYDTDPDLAQRFASLSDHRLEVLVGDVAAPRLGLGDETFDRLAREVDRVVHPAALVNHLLPYQDLFTPNVAGTAEVVRFALTHRLKPVDFVSSVAAVPLLAGTARDEDTPLLDEVDLEHRRTGYATGYGVSKWAAEQLLLSAHRRCGLPVCVFRGDMMLPHSDFRGQINLTDVFSRLLASVVLTGLAPVSFYRQAGDGPPVRAHYDGLPVDFVAAAIAGIGAASTGGHRVFHVQNPHADDGISLDTFVDWAAQAGYPVERVAPFEEWRRRFEDRLRSLPEPARQASSLPVLSQLSQPYPVGPMPGSRNFQEAVRTAGVAAEIPHLTRKFLVKCLADLAWADLIPAPAVATGSTAAPGAGRHRRPHRGRGNRTKGSARRG